MITAWLDFPPRHRRLHFSCPPCASRRPSDRLYADGRSFDRLLTPILVLGLATIVVGAIYNFRFVALGNIYKYREKARYSNDRRLLSSIVSNALLPFAFA